LAIYVRCKEWQVLPDKGGWFDQNPDICEAFSIMDDEINKVKIQEQKREEMKAKLQRRR